MRSYSDHTWIPTWGFSLLTWHRTCVFMLLDSTNIWNLNWGCGPFLCDPLSCVCVQTLFCSNYTWTWKSCYGPSLCDLWHVLYSEHNWNLNWGCGPLWPLNCVYQLLYLTILYASFLCDWSGCFYCLLIFCNWVLLRFCTPSWCSMIGIIYFVLFRARL